MTPEHIALLKQLDGKATPRPWFTNVIASERQAGRQQWLIEGPDNMYRIAEIPDRNLNPENRENARLMVQLRNDLPTLLSTIDDLQRDRDRLRTALADTFHALRVPAAEYVPAITDAWDIIGNALGDKWWEKQKYQPHDVEAPMDTEGNSRE